jgi:type I restriction enzyme M protein
MLVEKYLFAVVSLPSGVFQPYSGVKTSILLMDKQLAKKAESILFVKVENDGFDLGAQRRAIDKNDLTEALCILQKYKQALQENRDVREILSGVEESSIATIVDKAKIAKNGDYSLSGDRYHIATDYTNAKWPRVKLEEVFKLSSGNSLTQKDIIEGEYPDAIPNCVYRFPLSK